MKMLSSTDPNKEGREVPRKGNIPKRDVLPDPVYGSVTVAKLINSIMLDGKKGVAQSIVYDAFDMIEKQTGNAPLEVFEKDNEQYHARSGSQSPSCGRSQLPGPHGSPI
jgi:SSU ribosomal protein S7P